jgi:hypothetical protein
MRVGKTVQGCHTATPVSQERQILVFPQWYYGKKDLEKHFALVSGICSQ